MKEKYIIIEMSFKDTEVFTIITIIILIKNKRGENDGEANFHVG